MFIENFPLVSGLDKDYNKIRWGTLLYSYNRTFIINRKKLLLHNVYPESIIFHPKHTGLRNGDIYKSKNDSNEYQFIYYFPDFGYFKALEVYDIHVLSIPLEYQKIDFNNRYLYPINQNYFYNLLKDYEYIMNVIQLKRKFLIAN